MPHGHGRHGWDGWERRYEGLVVRRLYLLKSEVHVLRRCCEECCADVVKNVVQNVVKNSQVFQWSTAVLLCCQCAIKHDLPEDFEFHFRGHWGRSWVVCKGVD